MVAKNPERASGSGKRKITPEDVLLAVQRQAESERAKNGVGLVRGVVTLISGGKVGIRRPENPRADGVLYPIATPAYMPKVGEWVFGLEVSGGVVLLGRETAPADKDVPGAVAEAKGYADAKISILAVDERAAGDPPSAWPGNVISILYSSSVKGWPIRGTIVNHPPFYTGGRPGHGNQWIYPYMADGSVMWRSANETDGWTGWETYLSESDADLRYVNEIGDYMEGSLTSGGTLKGDVVEARSLLTVNNLDRASVASGTDWRYRWGHSVGRVPRIVTMYLEPHTPGARLLPTGPAPTSGGVDVWTSADASYVYAFNVSGRSWDLYGWCA